MNLSRNEIIDYALRYIPAGDVADFPYTGDVFCLLERTPLQGKPMKDDEGWHFVGYHICKGYTLDAESKPSGKWIWLASISLSSFPPTESYLKLQPPHIVQCRFQSPDRTTDFRIVKVPFNQSATRSAQDSPENSTFQEKPQKAGRTPGKPDNILEFPGARLRKKAIPTDLPPEPA